MAKRPPLSAMIGRRRTSAQSAGYYRCGSTVKDPGQAEHPSEAERTDHQDCDEQRVGCASPCPLSLIAASPLVRRVKKEAAASLLFRLGVPVIELALFEGGLPLCVHAQIVGTHRSICFPASTWCNGVGARNTRSAVVRRRSASRVRPLAATVPVAKGKRRDFCMLAPQNVEPPHVRSRTCLDTLRI
jgi:hypothetical protein